LQAAGDAIRAGRLVAFPTETVYGLGADATNGRAVARIFEAKGRPTFNPLIVHVPDLARALEFGAFDGMACELAAEFWPGALTIVAARRPDGAIAELATAGLATIALRAPAHPVARDLLAAAGRPIAAPSANRSGHVSPTTAGHVAADLGSCADLIIDGGAAPLGLESTIVSVAGGRVGLLRPGAIPRADLERVIGRALVDPRSDPAARPDAPGQFASHYAPRAQLRLDAGLVRPDEALLAFGPEVPAHDGPCINLSPEGDLHEAAARLFGALRELDASGRSVIAAMPVPEEGLGEAINDRLRRAAAPRTP